MLKKTLSMLLSIIMTACLVIGASLETAAATTQSQSRNRLMMLLSASSWDFDYTPQFWYVIYTRESYDAYLAAKQKAEKLLKDESATDDEFEAIIIEYKDARKNLVEINTNEPKSDSYKKLVYLIQDSFDNYMYIPEYLYSIYTKESCDAYLAATLKAEELLSDENATDEELENMIEEFKTARNNIVSIQSSEPAEEELFTKHEHCFVDWMYDDTHHWRECECGDWDGYGEHTFTKGFCTVCGAADPTYIPSVSDSNAIYGDVNGDGKITVDDVTLIQKAIVFLVKFDENTTMLADVNNDGLVNILDVTLIQKYIVKLNYNTELVGKPVKTN